MREKCARESDADQVDEIAPFRRFFAANAIASRSMCGKLISLNANADRKMVEILRLRKFVRRRRRRRRRRGNAHNPQILDNMIAVCSLVGVGDRDQTYKFEKSNLASGPSGFGGHSPTKKPKYDRPFCQGTQSAMDGRSAEIPEPATFRLRPTSEAWRHVSNARVRSQNSKAT